MWTSDNQRGNRHQRGYGNAWDKLREQILIRDDGLCQVCLTKDRLTVATQVDHIVSKAKGGTDNPDNLQSICEDCHKRKTIEETGKQLRKHTKGYDIQGNPIDSEHWRR